MKTGNVKHRVVPQIVVNQSVGKINESYNRLKDNIIYYSDDGRNKVFQVESSISGEGKSTITSNLAVSLAGINKKVVVLDLDFHRPIIHKIFNVEKKFGISDYMLGDIKVNDIVNHTPFNVDVICCGNASHNASVIFLSEKFHNFIEELKTMYDIILLDCPPILQISDYMHISKIADTMIFIVGCGVVRRGQFIEAMKLIKRDSINLLGTVMTFEKGKLSAVYENYKSYYGEN